MNIEKWLDSAFNTVCRFRFLSGRDPDGTRSGMLAAATDVLDHLARSLFGQKI